MKQKKLPYYIYGERKGERLVEDEKSVETYVFPDGEIRNGKYVEAWYPIIEGFKTEEEALARMEDTKAFGYRNVHMMSEEEIMTEVYHI